MRNSAGASVATLLHVPLFLFVAFEGLIEGPLWSRDFLATIAELAPNCSLSQIAASSSEEVSV